MENPQIYLASRSPRRRILIEQLGLKYQTLDVNIDEQPKPGEPPADYVARLAIEKAQKGWQQVNNDQAPVLGADTCIVFDGNIIGKVDSREVSQELLKQFSGNRHEVLTGIAMIGGENGAGTDIKQRVKINRSTIFFRELTNEECEQYWNTGEPVGKAGGYAIQGIAAAFIKKIEGSYSGVMGLPLCELSELLSDFGIPWLGPHDNKNW